MIEQRKPLIQSSSFGNPHRELNVRFYRSLSNFLSSLNAVLYPALIVSVLIALSLLIYAGIGIQHTERYVSDGTVFSCQVPVIQTSTNKR